MEDQVSDLQRAARVGATVQIQSVALETLAVHSALPSDGSLPQEGIRCSPSAHGARYEVVNNHLAVSVSLQLEALDEVDGERVLNVVATFRLLYSLPDMTEHSPEDLQCFARLNGTFNVWPYWRELVQSLGSRVGLSDLVIPVFRPHEWQSREEPS